MDYLIITISLFFSAFFSGIEIAFVSSNKLQIALDKEKGGFSEKLVFNFLNKQSNLITSMLIGNNIALVIYGIFMAKICSKPFELFLINVLYFPEAANSLYFFVGLLEVLFSSMIVLLIAEFLPKAIFSIIPNRGLKIFAVPISIIYVILYPLVLIIAFFSNLLLKLAGFKSKDKKIMFNRVDLDNYLDQHYTENQEKINPEVEILKNALDFSSIKVRDCMIPRTDVESIDVESNLNQLHEKFIESGHSKILVFKGTVDNILGYVHSYELFQKPKNIKDILLPISVFPESMFVKQALDQLLGLRRSIAVVIDEYGGTSGIICIEDIVEELFGEIEDEHDVPDYIEEKINDEKYLFSAKLKVNYLNEKYKLELPESEDYDTIGGMILKYFNKMPKKGDKIDIKGHVFIVSKVTDTFIEEVILVLNNK
jgi:CBS domain containing-hemolysin-like protein